MSKKIEAPEVPQGVQEQLDLAVANVRHCRRAVQRFTAAAMRGQNFVQIREAITRWDDWDAELGQAERELVNVVVDWYENANGRPDGVGHEDATAATA